VTVAIFRRSEVSRFVLEEPCNLGSVPRLSAVRRYFSLIGALDQDRRLCRANYRTQEQYAVRDAVRLSMSQGLS
jgi:hypothetical protein